MFTFVLKKQRTHDILLINWLVELSFTVNSVYLMIAFNCKKRTLQFVLQVIYNTIPVIDIARIWNIALFW